MPSSITLTVSHLPTSTSFFLSALQPLDYVYRGRSGDTIGFGPINTSVPPDFWITQEVPGVPVGAAHVAFPAKSRQTVQDFFVAALKAGGQIHGEPATRDSSGYYSAAIIDFDGNSIEAVYRPTASDDKENLPNDVRSTVSAAKSMARSTNSSIAIRTTTSRVAPTEVRSNVSLTRSTTAQSRVSTVSTTRPKGDVLDTLLSEARNAANVARDLLNQVRPNLSSSNSAPVVNGLSTSNNSDAIVGTLLGVAAGAALHYAFSNKAKDDDSAPPQRRPLIPVRSVTDPPRRSGSNIHTHHEYDYPQYRAIEAAPSAYSRTYHGGQRYNTMQDNEPAPSEYASTIRPAPRRRNSISGSSVASLSQTKSTRPTSRVL